MTSTRLPALHPAPGVPGGPLGPGHVQRHHHARRDRPRRRQAVAPARPSTAANTLPGADVIVLPAGLYKITRAGAGENGNATGDFDMTGDVRIQGAGAGSSIIDGQQFDRVFDVSGGQPSSIKVVRSGRYDPQRLRSATAAACWSSMPTSWFVMRSCPGTGPPCPAAGSPTDRNPGRETFKLVRATCAATLPPAAAEDSASRTPAAS